MTLKEIYAGYLFVYFTDDEGQGGGEEIYFSLSQGNDPLHWRELNGGKPILVSQLGEKGVRDPFLIRSPQGDKFFLLGTDLKAHGGGDWHRAVNEGSRSILVWESHDLIHWSEQRRVEIAPPDAGCAWAPEAKEEGYSASPRKKVSPVCSRRRGFRSLIQTLPRSGKISDRNGWNAAKVRSCLNPMRKTNGTYSLMSTDSEDICRS